jgi:hypothetical protein
MQLILDEIHAMQEDLITAGEDAYEEWASAAIINSSKVLGITVSIVSAYTITDHRRTVTDDPDLGDSRRGLEHDR